MASGACSLAPLALSLSPCFLPMLSVTGFKAMETTNHELQPPASSLSYFSQVSGPNNKNLTSFLAEADAGQLEGAVGPREQGSLCGGRCGNWMLS